jgi:hypothetical protein
VGLTCPSVFNSLIYAHLFRDKQVLNPSQQEQRNMPLHVDQTALIPIAEARQLLPLTVSTGTMIRWAKLGITNDRGQRIRLRTEFVGRRRCTSLAWLAEFRRATQPYSESVSAQPLVEVDRVAKKEKVRLLLADLLK